MAAIIVGSSGAILIEFSDWLLRPEIKLCITQKTGGRSSHCCCLMLVSDIYRRKNIAFRMSSRRKEWGRGSVVMSSKHVLMVLKKSYNGFTPFVNLLSHEA